MQTLLTICRTLLIWFGLIPKPALLTRIVADHPTPETIEPGWLYVVGGPGYRKWAYFRNPASTAEIIQLSLMPNRHPRWEVTVDRLERPTIHPSVRQLDGSFAHFWVKKGSIELCPDNGIPPSKDRRA